MSAREWPHRLANASDAVLAQRSADGDAEAFGVLVRRYAPMMRAYARRILARSDEVDDVVQEVFVTAWKRLPDLEEPARVKSWLMRIVSRESIDRVRASRHQSEVDHEAVAAPPSERPERQVEARAGIAALSDALSGLPRQQREAWLLREVGDLSYEEIAEDLGTSVSTVRGLLARARKSLLVRLEGWR